MHGHHQHQTAFYLARFAFASSTGRRARRHAASDAAAGAAAAAMAGDGIEVSVGSSGSNRYQNDVSGDGCHGCASSNSDGCSRDGRYQAFIFPLLSIFATWPTNLLLSPKGHPAIKYAAADNHRSPPQATTPRRSFPPPSMANAGLRLALSRCSAAPLFSSSAPSAAWLLHARRHASSAARRPTYSEISESLAVLGFGNLGYDEKELKKRYRELVKKNHPDAGGDEKVMARIAVAYERLSGLSKREKEDFKRQQSVFSGRTRAATYANPYQDHRYAHQHRQPGGRGFYQETPSGYGSQYYQQDSYPGQGGAQSSAYWNYYHRMQQEASRQGSQKGGQGFAENPFSSKNPFSFYTAAQRMRFMSPGSLMIQGLVLYLFLSMMFLFAYRALRDYINEDGWRMSDSLARHEQMQELHRLRQEMKERADLYKEMQEQQQQRSGSGGGSNPGHAFFYDTRVPSELRNVHVGETAEQRALEYARQRRLQIIEEQRRLSNAAAVAGNASGGGGSRELNSNLINSENSVAHLPELKGWPRISDQEGRIIKRAQDPPGVVFFEPRLVDARARQIFNRMRGQEKATAKEAAAPAAPPAATVGGTANSSSSLDERSPNPVSGASAEGKEDRGARPIGVPILSAAARAEAQGLPPQGMPPQDRPEANVGSVFAAQINNSADAREAMNTIFGALREARARNSS